MRAAIIMGSTSDLPKMEEDAMRANEEVIAKFQYASGGAVNNGRIFRSSL